ncbi:MAG: hypothetical protein M3N41_03730 [Acidobacteriota bacterium]|nr:hypothetical protein [Acidobacteriota bacterium]
MSKGFWIFLALGLAVVGALVFTMFTTTEGAHLRLEGKILKVRVLPLGGDASLVVVDFRATNPSNVPFVVNLVTLHLEPASGEAVDGRTASKVNIENIFKYEKLLGPKYNAVFSLQDRIVPHQTADLMAGARFELPASAIDGRKTIRLRLEDVDGAAAELSEAPAAFSPR